MTLRTIKKLAENFSLFIILLSLFHSCEQSPSIVQIELNAIQNLEEGTISVFRGTEKIPILVQNAKSDFRPYLHPIAAPDGNGLVTQYSPEHHKHQTGLYWGFTRVNGEDIAQDSIQKWFYKPDKTPAQKKFLGRDYFHNPGDKYWERVDFSLKDSIGDEVSWKTVYNMLDENGEAILEETQHWSMREQNGKFLIALEWQGKALVDITIGEYDYGGLFLRMPWHKGIKGEAVNFARQRNARAEGQHALWVDVGMQVEGRDDLAHVAIFDHPENTGFPQQWRVDGQLGVGPVRARGGDWKIAKGATEIIKHQLVVYTGELNDLKLTETWKQYVGNEKMYATAGLWQIARDEGRKAKFLTGEQAVEEMTIKEGYKVNAWATEPMLTQPMAFCWDDKGRIWIAENRDYESRRTGFSASGDSRILILEDTDGDGKADSRKVFAEGIPFPSAIAVGFDGVFVGAPPNLLFIPDRNKDDVGDMEDIEVKLTGWGIRDRHETINSFHWGPDGWLYGLEGFATPSKIQKPKNKGKIYKHNDKFPEDLLEQEGIAINGGVWRYHPTKEIFEVVAHGFSNPWGIDYDAKGELFISACVIPHLFHIIPGGIYHRQGGQHFSPYIYDDIKTIVDHRHRSAHGGARVYMSDAFPEDQKGRIFMANIHEHAVLSDVLTPKGSGFVASHGDDFMLANNAQWIGFSMEIGPEGALYVLDWHDADICGEDVLHKDTGRIFRIIPEKTQAEDWEGRYEDLNEQTDVFLVNLQLSSSDWHARRARIILQNRASLGTIDATAISKLQEIFKDDKNVDFRLRALWSLHIIEAFSEEDLWKALEDNEVYIRAWAVQLACENKNPSNTSLEKLESLAVSDSSPVVRRFLAASLQRIPISERWDIVAGLASRSEDSEDHNIPKMIWFGLEPAISADIDRALEIALKSEILIISEYIARRMVDANSIEELLTATENKSINQIQLLKGLLSELENRTDIQTPENWEKVYSKLKLEKSTAQIALEIAQQFGDTDAANQLMRLLDDKKAPIKDRERALTSLAGKRWPELKDRLPILVEDPQLSLAAIRAIAQYSDSNLGNLLFSKYESFNVSQKSEVIFTLASRREYAQILTTALKEDRLAKNEIPAYIARQLRRVMGNGFVEIWGPIDAISADLDLQYDRFKNLLTEEALQSADPSAGKALFEKTCAACHQMYGEGGTIGPELTGSNRTNTAYLLSNILEPSAEIQEAYKMVIITMRDGRTYLGNIIAETERQLTLKVVGQDQVHINTSEIQSRENTPNSMMPQGLLNTMTDQDVLDLVAYLKEQKAD